MLSNEVLMVYIHHDTQAEIVAETRTACENLIEVICIAYFATDVAPSSAQVTHLFHMIF